ncbi:MAG: DUF488 domain-containing protein [Gammaproteobacteria bacterium]|nr:DUF488 domain-containing protein [Gammaproteobacteria bacterium]
MNHTVYTIGHSNRSMDEFLTLLQQNAIRILVDVRAHPYSKRFPHFSQESLRQAVNANGIDYHWAGRQLGGMREASNPSSHPALAETGLRGFAEYMETAPFERAIAKLINLTASARTVIMCAEKLYEHCHRSLISDYLTLKNIPVVHIIDSDHLLEHQMSRLARTESGKLVYDRNGA